MMRVVGVGVLASGTGAAPLAPDDAAIQENLCLWLRSPDVHFDPVAGVWADGSGQGHDAETVGEMAVWGVTYAAPTLSFGGNPKVFRHSFGALKVAGKVDDLMRAGVYGIGGQSPIILWG
ncbi:MAG: hypothetical protein FJ280_22145 [Planctomycetes bacterium]|nr:hypothetical protein [Planctomycetota bacterium]